VLGFTPTLGQSGVATTTYFNIDIGTWDVLFKNLEHIANMMRKH